jgi:hypothetical protein
MIKTSMTKAGIFRVSWSSQSQGSALQIVHAYHINLLELCPRGNNKDVIIIILVHDNVYIPC